MPCLNNFVCKLATIGQSATGELQTGYIERQFYNLNQIAHEHGELRATKLSNIVKYGVALFVGLNFAFVYLS